MSGHGGAACFDNDGKQIWAVDLAQKFGARNIEWGVTESPLVDGERVFFTPGGRSSTIVALNRETGETIWDIKINGETSGYCSPCLVKHGQRRLLLTMTASSLVAVDADTGEFLWRQSHVTDYDVNANTPLYHGGYVFTDSGYGTGGQMFQISEDGSQCQKESGRRKTWIPRWVLWCWLTATSTAPVTIAGVGTAWIGRPEKFSIRPGRSATKAYHFCRWYALFVQ